MGIHAVPEIIGSQRTAACASRLFTLALRSLALGGGGMEPAKNLLANRRTDHNAELRWLFSNLVGISSVRQVQGVRLAIFVIFSKF